MKRGIRALIAGVVVFAVINGLFFAWPDVINSIIRFFADLSILFLGTGLYSKIFGSEYREFVLLSVLVSAIVTILFYFLVPNKNEN